MMWTDRHLNREVTIIIPAYNEEKRILQTVDRWTAGRMLERFQCIFVDDGSSDKTAKLLAAFCEGHDGARLVPLRVHLGKPFAIREALRYVMTAYVLCLDADTWFPHDPEELESELSNLIANNVDVSGFCLEPMGKPGSLVVAFQAAEYAFLSDVARRLFRFVGNVNGAAAFWRTDLLNLVLNRHSGIFEGDDLEATLIALHLGAKFHASPLYFKKQAKPSLYALARQRITIWDVGLFGAFTRRPPIYLPRSPNALFFCWYALFEGVLHPIKLCSFLMLVVSLLPSSRDNETLRSFSLSIGVIYLGAVAVSISQWLKFHEDMKRSARLFGLLVILYLYPTLHLWLRLSFLGLVGYLAGWSGFCLILSMVIADPKKRRRSSLLAPIMPFYFLFLVLVFRTMGMMCWIMGLRRSARAADPPAAVAQ